MIALSRMASKSSRPLSEWLGIEDPDIAFAFEVECSEILTQWEMEQETAKEKRMAEMSGLGQFTTALGAPKNTSETSEVERW